MRMRTSVDLDPELEAKLSEVVSLTKEKAAVVIRQALRVGLPVVAHRFQAPRAEGFFQEDYEDCDSDQDRLALESTMGKIKQRPER